MPQVDLILGKQIAHTLQGSIYDAKDADGHTYVVKEALASYVLNHISRKGLFVSEDIRKERDIMLSLNSYTDRPRSIVKAISAWDRINEPYEDDAFFLAMEKAPGVDFFGELSSFFLTRHNDDEMVQWQSTVQHVFGELCEAVAWLHSKNIVHLDISPENLLFGRVGDEMIVRLIDFGLAEVCEDGDFYMMNCSPGKLFYMSPEVIQGQFDASKADVWSMGVLLLTALSGTQCWETATPEDPSFVYAMRKGVKRVMRAFGDDYVDRVPEQACDLLERIFTVEEERMSAREMLAHPYLCGRVQSPGKTLSDDVFIGTNKSGDLSWMTDGVHSSTESLVDDDLLLRLDNRRTIATTEGKNTHDGLCCC